MAATFKDYYETLGVPRTATEKDIKAAFRKLARKHHPDVNPGEASAGERFKEINEAYEVLGDPEKRKRYDELGPRWREYEAWESARRPGPDPFGRRPEVEYRTVSPEDLEDLFGGSEPFSDFFQQMFRGARPSARVPRPQRGADVEGEAEITLEEAFNGTARTVEIDGRRVEVRIPAGIHDGARVRGSGRGGSGYDGGSAGDLYIRVHVHPHPQFRRDGDNLVIRAPVPLDIALLGGTITVATLKGTSAQVSVPPQTQNGARLRLRGLGMPRLKGGGNGDLIVELDVRLPSELTPEARELAQVLRREREGSHAA